MSDVFAPQPVKTKPGDSVAVTLAVAPTTPVTGTFFQATQPVSGTFFQATQPVSMATAPTTPVTGTFFQNTQPVSMATAPTTPVTGTFFQTTQPVSGAFFQATQPVSFGISGTTVDSGHLTSVSLAAGATITLDGAQITAGTGKLYEASVSSSVALKAQLGTFDGTTFVVKRTFFVPANGSILYEPSRFDAITLPTGTTAKFRWSITNNDNANAADVYASITHAI